MLVAAFVLLLFPTEPLRRRAERTLAEATGAQVSLRQLDLRFGWRGPGIRLEGLDLRWRGELPLGIEAIELHPVWSWSWLERPVLAVELEDPALGRLEGTAWGGAGPAFRGSLREFGLEQLLRLNTRWHLRGRLDADFDVARDGELTGSVSARARDGTLRIPGVPAPIPFETLETWILLGGDAWAHIQGFELEGPLVRMTLVGTIGQAPRFERAPLRLDGTVHADEPGVRGALSTQGLSFDAGGVSRFRVRGTIANPILE